MQIHLRVLDGNVRSTRMDSAQCDELIAAIAPI